MPAVRFVFVLVSVLIVPDFLATTFSDSYHCYVTVDSHYLDNCRLENICVLTGHTKSITAVKPLLQMDGHIVSSSHDSTLRVWHVGNAECVWLMNGHRHKIFCMCVLDDGRVVSGSRDKTLRLWDPTTGMCEQVMKGHQGSVWCVRQLSDGLIASGGNDQTVRVWAGMNNSRPEVHAKRPAVF